MSTCEPREPTPFRAPERVDPQPWDRLEAFLAAAGHRFTAGAGPRQFAGGFGNLNFLIEIDGRPMVLRRPPPGPLPPGGNDMAREYRVLSRLWRGFPLAPRARLFCADEGVLGAPFFVMDYRPGRVLRATLPPDLASAGEALSVLLVETLAALHRLAPATVGLDDLGRPEGFLERAVEGWIKRAGVACDGAPPAVVASIAAWLRAQRVPDGLPSLLHNDFKLDNIVLDEAGALRPVAVLDWDMCTRGDPLFDLATLLSYWTEAGDPEVMHALQQMPSAAPGFLGRREVVALYAEKTGRDVSDFLFHRVLCAFKLGVVFLQLHARWRRGATDDPRFAGFGAMAEGLLEMTHEIARGRIF